MPLNRTYGELIGNLGPDFHVMPLELYARMPEFSQACEHAAKKFKDAGAIESPIKFSSDDVVAQYYPNQKPTPLLVFLFCKKCKGGHDSEDGPRREAMPIERFVTYEYAVVPTGDAPARA